jgi:hypothetical protein
VKVLWSLLDQLRLASLRVLPEPDVGRAGLYLQGLPKARAVLAWAVQLIERKVSKIVLPKSKSRMKIKIRKRIRRKSKRKSRTPRQSYSYS